MTPPRVLVVLDVSAGRATVQVRGYRFRQPFADLGWSVEFVDASEHDEDEILRRATSCDVVYLVKIRSLQLVRRLKARGLRVVFDLTDPLWEFRYRRNGWWNLEEILELSDAVFSENEFVCAYGRRFNERVISIPVCTQVERFDTIRLTAPSPPTDRIVIGWVGSPSTVCAITKFEGVIEAIGRAHPEVEFVLLGVGEMKLPAWKHARVRVIPYYDEDTMIREILAMHIGIYPPPEDLHDYRVRGAHKALLYMTGGIATVALRAGDCATKIVDGETGMLVSSEAEWISKLSVLISDRELRERIAREGARVVRSEHTLQHVFECLVAALEAVIASPPTRPPSWTRIVRARAPQAVHRVRFFGERLQRKARRTLAAIGIQSAGRQ